MKAPQTARLRRWTPPRPTPRVDPKTEGTQWPEGYTIAPEPQPPCVNKLASRGDFSCLWRASKSQVARDICDHDVCSVLGRRVGEGAASPPPEVTLLAELCFLKVAASRLDLLSPGVYYAPSPGLSIQCSDTLRSIVVAY